MEHSGGSRIEILEQYVLELRKAVEDAYAWVTDEEFSRSSRLNYARTTLQTAKTDILLYEKRLNRAADFEVIVDDAVYLMGRGQEITSWTMDEWKEDPEVALSIANAIKYLYENGCDEFAGSIGLVWQDGQWRVARDDENPYFCPKCGQHWVVHDDDGGCIDDSNS